MSFIPVSRPIFLGNEEKYVNDCLKTTWISSKGKYLKLFEDKFSNYQESKFSIACTNGTVALHLALLSLNIQENDEVIVPSLTYIATANAVKYCNAQPVFAEINPHTWCMDPESVESKITENTKAIIVVHLYGLPANMPKIMKIAKKHNLKVIEDCAEAHGAEISGNKVGNFGDLATFSFYGNKIITSGEGGMITTNDKELANRIILLKNQGMDPNKRYWFNVIGYNYRMTNIAAAIGYAQLENINEHLNLRKSIAKKYKDSLAKIEGTKFQKTPMGYQHSYWMVCILIDGNKGNRDNLIEFLAENDIETRPFFYPIHKLPPYNTKDDLLITNEISKHGINLPTFGDITDEQIERVCQLIISWLN